MNNNPFKSLRIEYHILQSFPVTCLNRDDVGAPKSVIVGGVNRARVSSQCWKRQVRLTMHDLGVKIAVRTKKLESLFASACSEKGASQTQANECAKALATALAKDTLYFISHVEVAKIAEYAKEKDFVADEISKDKSIYKTINKFFNPSVDGLDIALFGRMVASAPELNVEAASRFAHAISTHKVSNEIDFFTAVDDFKDDESSSGAGHMGSLEYNSATYYRYVCLDLGQLYESFEGEDMSDAISAFTKALYLAIPSARQTTQTGLCPWEYAHVYVRKGQGVQASFEKPVKAKDGFLEPSIEALESWLARQEKLGGSLFGKINDFVFGKDINYSIDALIADIQKASKI